MEEKDIREAAIEVRDLNKVYKLYDKPSDRFKEALRLTRKQYREHYALRDVNMVIRQGETVGIIGTNGSGKSTILKIITGVLNPTSGQIRVNGRIPPCWSWARVLIWNTTALRMCTSTAP